MIDPSFPDEQYSVFGSIVTVGGMIGALVNGKLADLLGRRAVNVVVCTNPWVSIPNVLQLS